MGGLLETTKSRCRELSRLAGWLCTVCCQQRSIKVMGESKSLDELYVQDVALKYTCGKHQGVWGPRSVPVK